MSIGKRIRMRRLQLNLKQIELAERLGLKSKAAISTVENDKEAMTTKRIEKYAEALETTTAFLLGLTSDPSIPKDNPEKEKEPEVIYFDVDVSDDGVTYAARSNKSALDAEYKMLSTLYFMLTSQNRLKVIGTMQKLLMEQKGETE